MKPLTDKQVVAAIPDLPWEAGNPFARLQQAVAAPVKKPRAKRSPFTVREQVELYRLLAKHLMTVGMLLKVFGIKAEFPHELTRLQADKLLKYMREKT